MKHHPNKTTYCLSGILTLLALSVSSLCWALPEDKSKPITISADYFRFEKELGKSIYEGNVRYSQGTIHLEADKVVVFNNDKDIEKITAVGKPARYSETLEQDKDPIVALADTIEYDAGNNHIKLMKDARIQQKDDIFSAPFISYNLDKKIISSRGGRTEIVLHPQNHGALSSLKKKTP